MLEGPVGSPDPGVYVLVFSVIGVVKGVHVSDNGYAGTLELVVLEEDVVAVVVTDVLLDELVLVVDDDVVDVVELRVAKTAR